MSEHAPHVRIDDLLAHAGWVRGLAVSLVRDPGAADDLVQETWLAAMRRPPSGDRPVRGWLAGVVRNLARQRRRGEGRRARREAVVAEQRTPLPATGELAERMETQRDLAEAILALAEPWRSTVILRYLEGVSSAEIARRQGVPAATVRGRLRHGIEELRQKLDRRHGGDRHAWVAALTPFLPKLPSPTASGAAAAMLSGVLTMSLTAKLLCGAIVVFVLFGTLVATDILPLSVDATNEPASTDVSDADTVEPAVRAPVLDVADRSSQTGARGTTASEASPVRGDGQTVRIEARIVDEEGDGLAGATLRLRGEKGALATADEKGLVFLDIDLNRKTCALIAHAEGHVLREVQAQIRTPETLQLGDIALAPGGTVRGTVLDRDGQPVAGAQVVATAPDLAPFARKRGPINGPMGPKLPLSVVAVDGAFELPGLPAGFVRVWATHAGMRYSISEPVAVRPDRPTEGVVLRLEPLRPEDAIRGLVSYPDGKPAAGAQVRYHHRHAGGSASGSLTAADDGRFELRMGTGGRVTIRAKAQGGWAAPARFDVVASGEVVLLTLRKSKLIRVSVKKSDGGGLDGISIYTKSSVDPRVISWHTGGFSGDGIAELTAPNEAYRVQVTAGGYRDLTFGPYEADHAPEVIQALLERLPTLRGRVMAGGRPVAKARVRLHAPALGNERIQHNGFDVRVDPQPAAETRTDANGHYALGVKKDGTFVLRVDADDYAPSEKRDLRVDAERGDEGLDFELDRGGAIVGVVRTGPARSAVGLIVGVSRADGYAVTQRTGAGGAYRFERLMPGSYEVRLVEEEIVPSESSTSQTDNVELPTIEWSCRVTSGDVTSYDIDLRAEEENNAVLVGTVEVDGAAPQGWVYQLMTEPGERGRPLTVDRGALDAQGSFRATAKKPGPYRVMVTSEGQAQGRRAFFVPVVLDKGTNEWSIAVETGTLEGTLERGAPSPQERIFLMWMAPGGGYGLTQIQPDDEGDFSIEGVFAGKSRVVRMDRETMSKLSPQDAMNPENWPVVSRVEVKAGVVTTVKIP